MYDLTEHIIDGQSFWTPTSDSASIKYHDGTDRQNIDIALSHIPPNRDKLCIQAGGNLGFFPLKFANRFETVITFEPEPQNFYCLNKNVSNSNVVKIQAALGSEHRWIDIKSPNSNHVGLCEVDKDSKELKYPTIRIDDLHVPACDFIQLDLEGYEYFALLGGIETIDTFKPYLSIEMTGHETKYGVGPNEIEDLLKRLNYEQVDRIWLDNIYKHKDAE